jgi:hypothetical protein
MGPKGGGKHGMFALITFLFFGWGECYLYRKLSGCLYLCSAPESRMYAYIQLAKHREKSRSITTITHMKCSILIQFFTSGYLDARYSK